MKWEHTLLFSLTLVIALSLARAQEPIVRPVTEADIEKAVQVLAEKGYFGQGEFISTVKEAGPAGIPVLKKSLDHPNLEVRRVVLTALWMIHAPCSDVSDAVLPLLQDENKWVRYNALSYLGIQKCSEAREPAGMLFDKEPDADVQKNIVDLFGRIGTQSDVPLLTTIQDAKEKSLKLRLAASRSLIMLGALYDKDFLTQTLNDTDQQNVIAALQALEHSSDVSMIEKLKALGQKPNEIGPKALIVKESIELNRPDRLPDEKKEKLFFLLDDSPDFLQRWAAYRLLERYESEETIQRLRELALQKNSSSSQAAFMALEDKGLMTQAELMNTGAK